MDLAITLIQVRVPLQTAMEFFLEKYTEKSVPDDSTLRKNMLG